MDNLRVEQINAGTDISAHHISQSQVVGLVTQLTALETRQQTLGRILVGQLVALILLAGIAITGLGMAAHIW